RCGRSGRTGLDTLVWVAHPRRQELLPTVPTERLSTFQVVRPRVQPDHSGRHSCVVRSTDADVRVGITGLPRGVTRPWPAAWTDEKTSTRPGGAHCSESAMSRSRAGDMGRRVPATNRPGRVANM